MNRLLRTWNVAVAFLSLLLVTMGVYRAVLDYADHGFNPWTVTTIVQEGTYTASTMTVWSDIAIVTFFLFIAVGALLSAKALNRRPPIIATTEKKDAWTT